jgi:signal transduction histidine kinase
MAMPATVLCVDDDRAALATLARVLRDVAPVRTASTAAGALAALAPDVGVVVTDQRMPGAPGTELLARVAERDATIGRILLTAYADAEVLMDAINRGHVQRYLAKPWDPRELRAAVQQSHDAVTAERERRRLADEMAAAYERLRELDALKSRFLTLAAHELRTPLHVLGAALEALDGRMLPAADRDLLAAARRNAAWLARSVRAVTDLARLSAGRSGPGRALCVAALVRRAVLDAAPFCVQRALALHCDAPLAAPAHGDADDLHHALMNLVLNAIRFTPDGGAIHVSVTRGPARVVVAVADTGIGIAPEVRPRLCEPFVTGGAVAYHHSDPIAFRSGGLGLGLAVARAIVADHGGALAFEDAPDGGTIVRLALPIAASARA